MKEALIVLVRALNGGVFVVLFALLGEITVPKRFSGLFSAAPSIALANLLVVALSDGHPDAQQQSTGMIVGAIAMTIACAVGTLFVRRHGALWGSLELCGMWGALSAAGYVAVLR